MKTKILEKTCISAIMTVAVINLSFSLQSCEDTMEEDIDSYKLNIPEEYNEVGKLHNEGLDYVFQAIRSSHIENTNTSNLQTKSANIDYNEIVTKATLNFCKTNKALKESFAVCEVSVVNAQEQLKSIQLKSSEGVTNFSSEQRELLDEIKEALKIEYSNQNLKKLKEDLNQINLKASQYLTETEAAAIYCATSTAYCTYQYWHKNYKKWYFALHYPEILQQYTDAQLNNLSVKSEKILTRSGWWSNVWNSVEDWWVGTTDAVDQWWDNYGETILIADGVGAAWGFGVAITNLGAESLMFGPEGIVVVTIGGTVYGAVEASAQGIIGCEIYDLTH